MEPLQSDKNFKPKADYMKKQPDINDSMRTILVDWLVEVSEEYRLNGETLYLAVNYIDRFLSFMSVVRAKLQLVGATAILLASKFEEIYPPEVSEFVYICDGKIEFLLTCEFGFYLLFRSSFQIHTQSSRFCAWKN